MARYTQSKQNNKFAIFLQYLKENIKGELSADKYQRFPQIDTIILGVCGQVCLNYPFTPIPSPLLTQIVNRNELL